MIPAKDTPPVDPSSEPARRDPFPPRTDPKGPADNRPPSRPTRFVDHGQQRPEESG